MSPTPPEFEIKPAAAVIMDKEVEMPVESSAYASAVATSSKAGQHLHVHEHQYRRWENCCRDGVPDTVWCAG
jgi:hypothetical protein